MYFDINKYDGKFVMHCKTEEEAEDFLNHLRNTERPIYCSLPLWAISGVNVYYINTGFWSSERYAKENGYTILEWEDFMKHTFTKADLKTGDVIRQRNGLIGIVNCDLDMIITRDSWLDLEHWSEDLKTTLGNADFDIVEVRRPKEKGGCQFNAIANKWGALVYERKEVEEMTLEQVCALLGKEIKIIK